MPTVFASPGAAPVPRRAARLLRSALGAAALVACLALSACGGDDDDGADGASTTGAAAEAAYPFTIASKHGSATITEPPRRVVTLDNQATDDALALGVVPVAIAAVTYVPGGVQEWTKAALRGKTPPRLNTNSRPPPSRDGSRGSCSCAAGGVC